MGQLVQYCVREVNILYGAIQEIKLQRGGSVLATVIKNIFKANVVVMECKMFGEKKQGMAAVGGD